MSDSDEPLEQVRWEREFALKQADFRLREKQSSVWRNPVFLGLLVAALSLGGNVYATWRQSQSAERHEHAREQSSLVVEAIKSNDPKLAAKNLQFLINVGLLDDPEGKMRTILAHPDDVPYLPARGYGDGGYGTGGYGGNGDRPPRQ